MKHPKRTITVKASQVQKAIERAKKRCPRDWQAELLEILLIPNVNRRWKSVNSGRFPNLTLNRHKGRPFTGGREEAIAIEDWLEYAGYELGYGLENYCWNRARADYYGHSPSCAYDGVRRETYFSFAESLRDAYYSATKGEAPNWRVESRLWDYRIQFVNDL